MEKSDKERLYEILDRYQKTPVNDSILIGFDGFIDNIIEVANKRFSYREYSTINKMSEFANRIQEVSGKSTNFELIPKIQKIGGNGPIMGKSLVNLDIPVYLIGALGKNKINSLFNDLSKKCINCFSISDPGETLALEFKDGKIMLGILKSINKINWKLIKNTVSEKKLLKIFKEVKIISFLNWTMVLKMNDIIENFISLSQKNDIKNKYLFFDLTDFNKRSNKDIKNLINILKNKLSNFKIILGLNKHESEMLYNYITDKNFSNNIQDLSENIKSKLNLDIAFIHTAKKVAYSFRSGSGLIKTLYTEDPVISTGAGDHFNAGFISAFLKGFDIKDSILMAIMNSSYYVSRGETPNIKNLKLFINNKS